MGTYTEKTGMSLGELNEISQNLVGAIFPEANVLARASQYCYGSSAENYIYEMNKYGHQIIWNYTDRWSDGRIIIYLLTDGRSTPPRAILAIKGSDNPLNFFGSNIARRDWIRNIFGKILGNPWKKAYQSSVKGVRELMRKNQNGKFAFFITGHSAGGTLAQDISRKFNIPGASFCALGVNNRNFFSLDDDDIYLYHSAHSRFFNHIIEDEIAWIESGKNPENFFGSIIRHYPWGKEMKKESNPIALHMIDHFIQHHFSPFPGGCPCNNDRCLRGKC